MRLKPAHAVRSGVGESAARESESAQRRYVGKRAWRTPTPKFGPWNFGSAGLFAYTLRGSGSGGTPAAVPQFDGVAAVSAAAFRAG